MQIGWSLFEDPVLSVLHMLKKMGHIPLLVSFSQHCGLQSGEMLDGNKISGSQLLMNQTISIKTLKTSSVGMQNSYCFCFLQIKRKSVQNQMNPLP